jgi:integrase
MITYILMQDLAGHSSSRVTMDIYTYVNMVAKRDAVDAVSKLF